MDINRWTEPNCTELDEESFLRKLVSVKIKNYDFPVKFCIIK